MSDKLAIEAVSVGKRFQRHIDRRTSIKERIVRGRSRNVQDFWAVRDVSVSIPKGSVYGFIGHNGSGKSTLLKMMGGIYRPTEGSIRTDGRIAALIELGAGFHPDMTGRENIHLNGSILGLQRREINSVVEEIIDFSGLREFIDDPVKHYSSGMYVRLGFSVAVHMKPEILLVDEVLSVGDEEFQRKCFDHLYGLRRAGKTIVVVSHSLGTLEGLCDEVAWLERGEMQQSGQPTDVTASYLRRVNEQEAARNAGSIVVRDDEGTRAGDQRIRITTAELLNLNGALINHAEMGETFVLRLGVRANEVVDGPNFRVAIQHETGQLVTMVSNHQMKVDFSEVEGERFVEMSLTDNPLLPGRYRIHLDVFDASGTKLIDTWNDALEFAVRSRIGVYGSGLVQLPAGFRILKS